MTKISSRGYLRTSNFYIQIVYNLLITWAVMSRDLSVGSTVMIFISCNAIYLFFGLRKHYDFEYDNEKIIVDNGMAEYRMREILKMEIRQSRGTYEVEFFFKKGNSSRFAVNFDEFELRQMVQTINKLAK
jgi:hypothetical protein